MANTKHLKIIKKGTEAWNKWRTKNNNIIPDLTGANLSGANLGELITITNNKDHFHAEMVGVNLYRANLAGAKLTGANLCGANLILANLARANLVRADLTGAKLGRANLKRASLREANLNRVNLIEANMTKARLRNAKLVDANLNGVNLTESNLTETNLRGANLREANLEFAMFEYAFLLDVNLSQAKNLEKAKYRRYSYLHSTTLERSGLLPVEFLRGCGLKDWEIENTKLYQKDLTEEQIHQINYEVIRLKSNIRPFEYHKCFISYSHKDERFAKKLYDGLQSNGVRCWYAPKDMKGGEKIHEQIQQSIQIHDKLLLILSEKSINSDWVAYELKQCRKREKKEGRQMLFPISLMPYENLKGWELFDRETVTDLAAEVREYFIPDFTEWMDEQKFQASFEKLLDDLGKA